MRLLLLLLLLTFTATGCRTHPRMDDAAVAQREREVAELPEKRKHAWWDLSELRPSNGPDAYFEDQAEKQAQKHRAK